MSKLLILIDVQNGFDCTEARDLIKKFNKCSFSFDDVCFAMFENRKNSLFETQLKWLDFQNEEDKKLIDGIEVPENAHFSNHHNYTVYNDELKNIIKKLKPTKIYLAGLFSDVCLLKTSMDMFDDGIVPYIVRDLSGSPHGNAANDVALATMEEALGEGQVILAKDI
ncbi:isochorismatase family protein [Francisella sp. SYW-9]|uniref:isochorismatase family protein n=1 Tax=Francisella sp. SYW-9 TaxID=2610888 RepID=UPI00123D7BE7|nr:isochorismatase family protein [Francisella sp. SYW-9]